MSIRQTWGGFLAGVLCLILVCYSVSAENSGQYWAEKGNEAMQQEDYSQAIDCFSQAIGINPSTIAYHLRMEAYRRIGNNAMVIADCTQILKIDPNDATAYIFRGGAYEDMGDNENAFASYTEAINICQKKDYVDSLNMRAHAYCSRAALYSKRKNYKKALEDCNKGIRIDPEVPALYGVRGFIYGQIGDYDNAIADFSHAIKQALKLNIPKLDLARFYDNRSLAYVSNGDYDNAWADVRRAENLGLEIDTKFLEGLRQISGRDR